MPWVIPPWLDLVEFLGLTAKEYNEHNNDKAAMSTMTATTATDRGGILPRLTRGMVIAATCPDGLPPRASRGEGRREGNPCHAAADTNNDDDDDNNSHIGDVRVDGIVEDDGDDDNLDNDDNDKGEDKNGDDDDNNAVVLGEAAAAAAPTTRMAATMATMMKVMWTAMAATTTTTTSMTLTMRWRR